MAHLELIEDKEGDLVGVVVYCSDFCHRDGAVLYQGWNGCNEISTTEPCATCGAIVPGLDEG